MAHIIPMEADNIVGMRVKGKLSEEDFDRIVTVIDERLTRHEKLRIYVEMESFGGMSLETFFKDVQFGLKRYDRFDKKAIVTDQAWVQKVVPVVDKLFPNIEVKAFPFEEKERAKEWVLAP